MPRKSKKQELEGGFMSGIISGIGAKAASLRGLVTGTSAAAKAARAAALTKAVAASKVANATSAASRAATLSKGATAAAAASKASKVSNVAEAGTTASAVGEAAQKATILSRLTSGANYAALGLGIGVPVYQLIDMEEQKIKDAARARAEAAKQAIYDDDYEYQQAKTKSDNDRADADRERQLEQNESDRRIAEERYQAAVLAQEERLRLEAEEDAKAYAELMEQQKLALQLQAQMEIERTKRIEAAIQAAISAAFLGKSATPPANVPTPTNPRPNVPVKPPPPPSKSRATRGYGKKGGFLLSKQPPLPRYETNPGMPRNPLEGLSIWQMLQKGKLPITDMRARDPTAINIPPRPVFPEGVPVGNPEIPQPPPRLAPRPSIPIRTCVPPPPKGMPRYAVEGMYCKEPARPINRPFFPTSEPPELKRQQEEAARKAFYERFMGSRMPPQTGSGKKKRTMKDLSADLANLGYTL